MKKRNIPAIVGSAIVAILVIWGISAAIGHFSGASSSLATSTIAVNSLKVEKPNLIVVGTNLTKVTLYAVPTGTNVSESDVTKLGDATLQETNENTQTWAFPIPKQPILATDIYAVGYDVLNNQAGSASLGITGATAINNALWGNGPTTATSSDPAPTSKELQTLKVGGSGAFDKLALTLKSIETDSRCPVKVQCIQAGSVAGSLDLTLNGATVTQKFDSAKPLVYQGYTITVDSVTPESTQGTKDFTKYAITFRIQES